MSSHSFLTLPNTTRARHKVTRPGRKEAKETKAVARQIKQTIVAHFGHLAELCEILKREGLPPNEVRRFLGDDLHITSQSAHIFIIQPISISLE